MCKGFRELLQNSLCQPKLRLQGKASKGVKKFVDQKGLIQVSDPAQIEAIIDAVIAANQKQLEQYKAGKTKLQGHFVG